jgi:hypothetical protein
MTRIAAVPAGLSILSLGASLPAAAEADGWQADQALNRKGAALVMDLATLKRGS